MNTENKFMFSGHESLFGRAGVDLYLEHMSAKDVENAMKEIEDMYKYRYGYKCVRVLRNINDPFIVDVYVVPKKIRTY